jgi:hypothetical protein
VQQGHCPEAAPKRRARRGTGEAQERPPVEEAIPLFMQALQSLSEKVEALRRNRKEYLQDGRFVAKDEHRDPIIWPRGLMSDEQWKNICERAGGDFNSDRLELWDARFVEPVGATQTPPEPLTTLIGVYVLAGLPLPSLLDRLHFAPESVDEAELARHIEGEKAKRPGKVGKMRPHQVPGLKTKAAQVAQLVRGKTLRRGPSTEESSPGEQNVVWYRQQRVGEGATDDGIYRELKDKRALTRNDYDRQKKIRVDAP